MLLCAVVARADGGQLQMRRQAGPFVVSLFSNPGALAIGDADLSVLVEQASSGRVLPHADVVLQLTPTDPPGGPPVVARLTRSSAGNRLLSDAVVSLPHAGRWRATLRIRDGDAAAETAMDLTVAPHSARRATIWFFALAPVLALAIFLWMQAEKRALRLARVRPPA